MGPVTKRDDREHWPQGPLTVTKLNNATLYSD